MTTVTVKMDGHTYECSGSWVPYVRANTSGPSDNWYPAEGGYFEDFEVEDETGQKVTDSGLLEEIHSRAAEKVMDDSEYCWDEP